MIKKIFKFVLPVLIIVLGFLITGWMLRTPQTAQKQEIPEKVTPVKIMRAVSTTETIFLDVQGTVLPAKSITLRPEVPGRVIEISPDLVPGGYFRENQQVLKIDPRDYEFAVTSARERVANADFKLKMEKSQQTIAQQEWELLEDSVPTTEEGKELALRIPQIESAQSSLQAAESALEKAKLDLSRTTVTAPFNAVVMEENVDVGQVISGQTNIATLAGTDQFWVRVSVPMDELSWIDIPATPRGRGAVVKLIQDTGKARIPHTGYVIRLLSTLDEGRLARLLVAVNDPLLINTADKQGKLPLLIGTYVNARIQGSTVERVFVIPREALRDVNETVQGERVRSDWVWIMNEEDRLSYREISVLWRDKYNVYSDTGLADGDRIIISQIATPVEGMKLEVESVTETPQQAPAQNTQE